MAPGFFGPHRRSPPPPATPPTPLPPHLPPPRPASAHTVNSAVDAVYIARMNPLTCRQPPLARWDRRSFLTAALGTTALARVGAQAPSASPPQVIPPAAPPRDWSKAEPLQYPD